MPKTFLFSSIILLCLSISATTSYAQSPMQTVVYLKDGSIYRGTTVSTTDTLIKIKTEGSNVIAIKKMKIDSIKTECLPKKYLPYIIRSKGYFDVTKVDFLNGNSEEPIITGIETVNGYRFGRLLAIGIGAGVVPTEGIPVYLSIYSDLLTGKISPFLHADVGRNFIIESSDPDVPGIHYAEWYLSAGAGLTFHTTTDVNIIAGISYVVNYCKTENTNYLSPTNAFLTPSQITLELGFGF